MDLQGFQYGHLTILHITEERSEHGAFMARCRCHCGNIVMVPVPDLVNYRTVSCADCQTKFDPIGMRFYKLTVVGTCPDWPDDKKVVVCKCDCGGPKCMIKCSLDAFAQSHKPKSCGCLCPQRQAARVESFVGLRFGRLEVIDGPAYGRQGGRTLCLCRCECGKVCAIDIRELRHGNTSSCGCLRSEQLVKRSTKFESDIDRILSTRYKTIYRRCYDQNQTSYQEYGAKGIRMCDEWADPIHGKDRFMKWAKESGFREGLTIERKDFTKGYSPENCTWIPPEEQAVNRSIVRHFTFCGITKYAAEWGRFLGHTSTYIWCVIKHHGFDEAMKVLEKMVRDKLNKGTQVETR